MDKSSALKYGYSSTRVKAMESKLLDSATMQSIINAKDMGTILSALVNTDYNKALSDFGGIQIKQSLIDFALSKNFAEKAETLVRITPKKQQHIVRALMSRFGLSNVKIAIEAKERKLPYEEIARYIIDYGHYNQQEIKNSFKENGVGEMLAMLQKGSPFPDVIRTAIADYAQHKDVLQTIEAIDNAYYKSYEPLMEEMMEVSKTSPIILGLEIDTRNLLTLLKAKRRGLKFEDVSMRLIKNGRMGQGKLMDAYTRAKDISEFVKNLNSKVLIQAEEEYKKTGQMLSFEIALKNDILTKSIKLLKSSVLSFSVIIAYIYLKEMEVIALRVLIKSKVYGLQKEEIARMITWKLN